MCPDAMEKDFCFAKDLFLAESSLGLSKKVIMDAIGVTPQVYRLYPASKLVQLYEPLHTQDPEGAIQTVEQAIHYLPPKDINEVFLENYRAFRKKEKAGYSSREKDF